MMEKKQYIKPESLLMSIGVNYTILITSPTGEGYDEPEGYDAF